MTSLNKDASLISTRNIPRFQPCIIHYYGHASSLRIPGLYHIQGIKWRMITTFNRKLLEKQRAQNRFASYEVHIGHFFYNVSATVSFGNRLTLRARGNCRYMTLHYSPSWLYFTLLDSTLFTTALLHSIWPYITLPWIYFSLLDSTSFYIGSTSLYLTL